jgi:hypothetical protein
MNNAPKNFILTALLLASLTIALLDIADTRYPELIRAVRKAGGEMYELRSRENDHATQGILR